MPIVRHGYVTDAEKGAKQKLWNSQAWKRTLLRDHLCVRRRARGGGGSLREC